MARAVIWSPSGSNPTLRALCQSLVMTGKAKNLALTAMREFLVVLDAMLRGGILWNERHHAARTA